MTRLIFLFGITLALIPGTLLAQPDARQFGVAMGKNQEALRDYTWQSRTEVTVDGQTNKVDLYQMRYNLDGELEKTRLGGDAKQKREVRGVLRKRVAKKKKREAGEFAEAVKLQLQNYMAPNTLQNALSNAFMRRADGTIMLRSQDVVVQGDSMEFELAEETRQPTSMRISTFVEKEPVNVTVDFQRLPDGPNYPARQVIESAFGKKKLEITTENFNYQVQSR